MRTDGYFDSCGAGRIHYCCWTPEGKPKAVLQILHGIAEHVARYDAFAEYLCQSGYVVVAEDHMGHGQSIGENGIRGYFHGGWFSAVADSYRLLVIMQEAYPGLPYVLFGHSMGSFMARTILAKYPESGISACIVCGTAWQPAAMLKAGVPMAKLICRLDGETNPSQKLQGIAFGGYNKRVERKRTEYDWLSRDTKCVDAYIADPLCGFTASAGLLRDMMMGIAYIQKPETLASMRKDLPVFFIAGGDDPVGAYGDGVRKAAQMFRKAGMEQVAERIYPLCRHELLNEINKEEVYQDVTDWLAPILFK